MGVPSFSFLHLKSQVSTIIPLVPGSVQGTLWVWDLPGYVPEMGCTEQGVTREPCILPWERGAVRGDGGLVQRYSDELSWC